MPTWSLEDFVIDSSVYDGNWYLGSFGSSFNDQGWNGTMMASKSRFTNGYSQNQHLYRGGIMVSKQ